MQSGFLALLNKLLFGGSGCRCCRCFGCRACRCGAVGGVRILEEGVGDSVYVVEFVAGAEVAVDDGVAARGVLECVELEES